MTVATTASRGVALITGAARGLGQAFADILAEDDFDIIAADIVAPDETQVRVHDRGRQSLAFVGDITEEAARDRLFAAIRDRFGALDVLVNNAGIYPTQPVESLSFADWRRVMALNLDAPLALSLAAWPLMAPRGEGRIVSVASAEVFMSVPNNVAYIASKMGVIGMTRGLATDLGPKGITVNAVAPGLTRTPGTLALPQTIDLFEMLPKMQAIQRPGEPSDIAGVVSFLCSEKARFVTGQTIVVDGGLARI